jgi:hypothetical protein
MEGASFDVYLYLELILMQINIAKTAYIPYVSLVDHTDNVDIVRANPKWFNQSPRYDFVLLDYGNQTMCCAQILRLFNILDHQDVYPTAYVRLLGKLTRSKATSLVQCADGNGREFVPLASIIRSVHVYIVERERSKRYIISDLIDSDVYLRLKVIQ